jgi:hypothetical protein
VCRYWRAPGPMPCLKRWAGVGDWRESHRCFRFLRCDYRQCAGSTGPSVFADQSDQGTVLEFRYQRDCGRTADGDDHPAVLEAIGDGGLCREGLNPRSPKPADAPFLLSAGSEPSDKAPGLTKHYRAMCRFDSQSCRSSTHLAMCTITSQALLPGLPGSAALSME